MPRQKVEQAELELDDKRLVPPGFRPMLASALPENQLPAFPCLVSPKLDGVRAVVFGGVVWSRKLKPIPNKHVQQLFGRPELEGFDGELTVGPANGRDVFHLTMSGVMSEDGEPDVRFNVFDVVGGGSYSARTRVLHSCKTTGVAVVEQWITVEPETLRYWESRFLEDGYEGAMVRDPEGRYKFGRSTVKEGILLKVKRFCDAEARVVGFEELEHNENQLEFDALGLAKRSTAKDGKVAAGTLGNLLVEGLNGEYTGVRFSIGGGFTEAQRREIWSTRDRFLGLVCSFKYFPTGSKTAPRFPVFKGWRETEIDG